MADWLRSRADDEAPAEPGRASQSCSDEGGRAAAVDVEHPLSSRSAETDAAGTPGSAAAGQATGGEASGEAACGGLGQEPDRRVAKAGAVLAAEESNAAAAAEALGRGDVVAVPTDTLYGLAACANNKQVGNTALPNAGIHVMAPHHGFATDVQPHERTSSHMLRLPVNCMVTGKEIKISGVVQAFNHPRLFLQDDIVNVSMILPCCT